MGCLILSKHTNLLTFIVFFPGYLADAYGRRPVFIAGFKY